jgi:hypothetical protein
MPWRMPNWKMRANALDDGMPTTRLCRMPILGWACIMRVRRTIWEPDIRLSASSGSISAKSPPQRAQKSRTLPAL